MILAALVLVLALVPAAPPATPAAAPAAARPGAPAFGPEWSRLVGEWKGKGSGAPRPEYPRGDGPGARGKGGTG